MNRLLQVCLLLALCAIHVPASAAECAGSGSAQSDFLLIEVGCTESPASETTPTSSAGRDQTQTKIKKTKFRCDENGCLPNPNVDCPPGEEYLHLWGLAEDGTWHLIRSGCMSPSDEELPTITPALVLAELRRVGLPALSVSTTPADKTLVNLDTVFHTDPATVTRQLVLLGQAVTVEATPVSFGWDFGDGARDTTAEPGQPYPALDITHRYADAAVTVRPSVTTVYTGRFRVDGGPWTDVGGTVTIPGPALPLRVAEATPVLSGNR